MAEKIKVLGLGSDNTLSYLILEKKKGFFEWLNKLLSESFGGATTDVMFYESKDLDGKIIQVKRDVNEEVDLHEYFDTKSDIRINLFYGKDKVFLTFNCSLDKRKIFMDKLEEISEFND